MQVFGQVLRTLKGLHEAGYAHRNIKPSNILLRPQELDWLLSDFASCCPLGTLLGLLCSPMHCPSVDYNLLPFCVVSLCCSNRNSTSCSRSYRRIFCLVLSLSFTLQMIYLDTNICVYLHIIVL